MTKARGAGARPAAVAVRATGLVLRGGRTLDWERGPVIMGILNVTPDSFSDGGMHYDRTAAVDAALRMEAAGAAVIDIGGESTRPGAEPVSLEEELHRVLPVVERIRKRSTVPLSVDTSKAAVAAAALDAGADMINDVTALRGDAAMSAVVRDHDAPLVLMHMRGTPRTMQEEIAFDDVVREVAAELRGFCDAAVSAGIEASKVLVDPGIGFGKSFEQNLELLARAGEFREVAPVVIGASRKGFIGQLTGREGGAARAAGSLAAVAAAADAGAAMVRVHDVGATIDFLRVYLPIRSRGR